MINATTAPIAEQILDIAEATSPLTIRAEQDAERDALYLAEWSGEVEGYAEFERREQMGIIAHFVY